MVVSFSKNLRSYVLYSVFKKQCAVLYMVSFVVVVVVVEDLTIRKELLLYNMIAEISKMPDFRDEFEFHILRF